MSNAQKDKKETHRFIMGNMMLAEYSNLIEGEIAGKLNGLVMKDPLAAKQKIQQILL